MSDLTAAPPPTAADPDSRDLARQGYRQELARTLGAFSAFAAGFSYLSILTGLFQNFHLGYGAGGPAFFWTWPLMFLGQLMVALCFAELSARHPLCGGVYQWANHVGPPSVGWLAGYVYFASLVVTLAAVALALNVTLPQLWPAARLTPNPPRNAVLLGVVLVAFSTLVNSFGVGLMARINNVGVFAELFGALLLVVLLAFLAVRGPVVVLDTQGKGAGAALGYFGPFAAAAIVASYVMYGYDTAGTLAEETADPRRRAPRAILQALTAAAVLGGLLLLFALMAAPDLGDVRLASEEGGLPFLVTQRLGGFLGAVFLADVVFAITVCVLAVHAGAVRLLFAMARDGRTPLSGPLARVGHTTRTPTVPALLVGGLALGLLLVNLESEKVVGRIVYVSIVWANLAYLLVTVPLLWCRLRGWPKDAPDARGLFTLGRWGLPVNVLAVVWGTLTAVNMGWPRAEVYGDDHWYDLCAAPLYTGILLAVGLGYYKLVQRRRDGRKR
jgi:urea carboxylase system permease